MNRAKNLGKYAQKEQNNNGKQEKEKVVGTGISQNWYNI